MNCKCICHEKDFKLGHDTPCCENMNGYMEWEDIERDPESRKFFDSMTELQYNYWKSHFLSLQHRIKELEEDNHYLLNKIDELKKENNGLQKTLHECLCDDTDIKT